MSLLNKKKLSKEDRFRALTECLTKNGRIPGAKEIYRYNGKDVTVGSMYSAIKTKGSYPTLLEKLRQEFNFVDTDIKQYESMGEVEVVSQDNRSSEQCTMSYHKI